MDRYFNFRNSFWYSILIHAIIFATLFVFTTRSIISHDVYRQLAEFKLEDHPLKRDQASSLPQRIASAAKASSVAQSGAKPPPAPVKPAVKSAVKSAPTEPELKPEKRGDQAVSNPPQGKEAVSNDPGQQAKAAPLDQPSDASKSAAISLVDQPPNKVALQSEGAEFAGAWGAYGRNLTQACLKFRRYPAAAAAGGVRGAVYVGIRIRADGVSEINLKRSSGFKVLDDEALRMVEQATKAVPLPDALRNKAKELIIPIGFEM